MEAAHQTEMTKKDIWHHLRRHGRSRTRNCGHCWETASAKSCVVVGARTVVVAVAVVVFIYCFTNGLIGVGRTTVDFLRLRVCRFSRNSDELGIKYKPHKLLKKSVKTAADFRGVAREGLCERTRPVDLTILVYKMTELS